QNISGKKSDPFKTIQDGSTAWSYAGVKYNSKHTFYILPSGNIIKGVDISDWDDLPMGTRLIIDYKGPYLITAKKTPFSISGLSYQSQKTIYHIPPNQITTGDQIVTFTSLPKGTRIFLPLHP
ncbi:MAG: N-acetylmuramoyl-L-alanine amidase, partial [Deltaproteobacteria bacterium]